MMTLIAAALVAAAPAPPANAPAQAQPMNHPMGEMKSGTMAEMKDDCCCKDMMAKMHDGHAEAPKPHSGR